MVQLTPVRVGIMDLQRPQVVVELPVEQLGLLARLKRASVRLFGVSGSLLLVGNVALLMAPFPHVHLCLFPVALALGPLLGYFAFRDSVLLPSISLPCPRCHEPASAPANLAGWPARFNCARCGIMIELNAALAPEEDSGSLPEPEPLGLRRATGSSSVGRIPLRREPHPSPPRR